MNLFYRVVNKFRKSIFNKKYRSKVVERYRNRLTNTDFSIICNNCFGGILYHDLGVKFLSPTINMYIKANDYIEFLENLDYYLTCDLVDGGPLDSSEGGGVIALLDGKIGLYGIHYNSFEEMSKKWYERRDRLNKDNLFIIGSYRDGCNDDLVERFCALPYKNKVFISHKPFPYDCVVTIDGYSKEAPSADAMFSRKMRAYDNAFDFVAWLNNGGDRTYEDRQ